MSATYYFRLLLGPLLGMLMAFCVPLDPANPLVARMTGVVIWVAWWWLTEVVNLAVTSLVPFVLLPLLGIVDAKTTASQYFDQIIFLFVGGFMLSYALEKWHLHHRLSLAILARTGGTPAGVLAGVMGCTFFVSMWMSNTATVMLFLSAVLAVNGQLTPLLPERQAQQTATALLLGLAYSATLGGMATLVGTPTNMIFYSFYTTQYPQEQAVTFASWMGVGLPVAVVLLVLLYAVLGWWFVADAADARALNRSYFAEQYQQLGRMSYEQKVVSWVSLSTALLWFSRQPLQIGGWQLMGWSRWFSKGFVEDSTVAVLMSLLLFVLPSRADAGKKILHWSDVQKMPFDIILLFGGGFALSKGFEASGLSQYLAGQLNFLQHVSPLLILLAICVVVCVISEFASNVASIQLVLPILVAVQQATNLPPLLLLVPATLAASLGFMLPIATAANTIVYGTQLIPLRSMLRVGFWLDLLGIVSITMLCYVLL